VVGMRDANDLTQNVAHFAHPIEADFWRELKDEGLLAPEAPTG